LLKNAIENVAPGLLKQFVDWINSGRMFTRDGTFDYSQGLSQIKLPALFVAGARDHVAPLDAVRYAFDSCGSRQKEFRIMGREGNVPHDYCHTGLMLADRAILDVYPVVLEWLDRFGMQPRRRG